jgi:hypothetical protein
VDRKRSAYQDQQAEGLITLDELRTKLSDLEETRSVALAELEALRSRREQIERLEDDAHVLLKHYAWMVPETLDNLTSEERHSIYRMLRLKAVVSADGSVEVTGVFGGPLETSAHRSTKTEVTWLRIPEVDRTHGIRFRAFLTDNGIERLELTKA